MVYGSAINPRGVNTFAVGLKCTPAPMAVFWAGCMGSAHTTRKPYTQAGVHLRLGGPNMGGSCMPGGINTPSRGV
jgi:hypothetical protein